MEGKTHIPDSPSTEQDTSETPAALPFYDADRVIAIITEGQTLQMGGAAFLGPAIIIQCYDEVAVIGFKSNEDLAHHRRFIGQASNLR